MHLYVESPCHGDINIEASNKNDSIKHPSLNNPINVQIGLFIRSWQGSDQTTIQVTIFFFSFSGPVLAIAER